MASTSFNDLTPDTREKAEAFMQAAAVGGFQLSVASTLRSCADQGTSTGPITIGGMVIKRAVGCRSWHVWGRAFDVVINNGPTKERYLQLGELGEALGLEWGGRFVSNPDPIHFQYHPGLDIQKLCPDPLDCASAVARAGGTVSTPVPVPSPNRFPWLGFFMGLATGWVAVRWRKRP